METIDYMYGKIRSYIQPYIPIKGTMNEISPNVYLGDFAAACDLKLLKSMGITHVLCTVIGVDPIFPSEFVYKNVHLRDNERQNIMHILDNCVKFIDRSISDGESKVFVHCMAGISRSSTMVIAYLINHHSQQYHEAIQQVKSKRDIVNPNNGFRQQLASYDLIVSQRNLIMDNDTDLSQQHDMIKSCNF